MLEQAQRERERSHHIQARIANWVHQEDATVEAGPFALLPAVKGWRGIQELSRDPRIC